MRDGDGDDIVRAWDRWTNARVESLTDRHVLRSLRPVRASFDALGTSSSTEVRVSLPPMEAWLRDEHDLGGSADARASFSSVARRDTDPVRGFHGEAVGNASHRTVTLRLFSSNDYLGLSAHPFVRSEMSRAASAHGAGPRSSPLVCGYTAAHRELELGLAALKRAEECLLFPTGFAANLGILPALADSAECELFSDRLNHASIVDGCKLASLKGCKVSVYEHADVRHLETLLRASRAKRKLIVTESLFSVDGDWAPLDAIAALKRKVAGVSGDILLVVDEAHSTLVCGRSGAGACEMFGLCADDPRGNSLGGSIDVHVGTLSKAFGSHGGFVCCSRDLKKVLLSTSRSSVFSTALPAPCVYAALASLKIAGSGFVNPATGEDDGDALRARLWRSVRTLNEAASFGNRSFGTHRSSLDGLRMDSEEFHSADRFEDSSAERFGFGFGFGFGFRGTAVSPVATFAFGDETSALKASRRLLRRGVHAPAIRPPTVPKGTSRIRITLSAAHSEEDLDALVRALTAVDAKL
jgi:8-amino-7-oxononanoate synthase